MIESNHTVDLESLVMSELPPLPDVAMRVAALTQDVNTPTRVIADAIGCDPILGAKVLRAANSPLYYLERDVTTLKMAVNALGNENIHQLVLASAVVDAFQSKSRTVKIEATLWEHSIAVGLASREIMWLLEMRGTEQGFICGLLHDIGKLLLLRHDPETYIKLVNDSTEEEFHEAERIKFGFSHGQVGSLAAKRWSLPDQIVQAIYYHHEPGEAKNNVLIARVINLADALANRAGLGLWGKNDNDLSKSESVIAFRLSEDQLKTVWDRTLAGVKETQALFSH